MCSYTNFLLLGTQFLDHVVMNSSAGENISNLVTEGYHSKSSLSEDGERNGLRCSNNQNLCSYSDSDINGIDIVDCGEHGVPKCDQQSGSKAKKTGLSRIMHRVSKKFSRFSSKTSYNVSLKNSVLSSNVNSRQTDLAVLDFENADPPVLWRSRSMAISTSFHEVLDGREVDGAT
uniref:Uncharacterized protein n=1 Tax=Acrobeloides nanus TaxID=290746 RepID=A0A914BYL7_9BILA